MKPLKNPPVLRAASPQKDRDLGLNDDLKLNEGGRRLITYSPDLALQVCEMIAEGATLIDICAREDMPSRQTFHRWVLLYPDLAAAYRAAREASAFYFDDEAINAARHIKMMPGDSVKVRSYEVFLNHIRWTMARRNPAVFSDKVAANITVPIQINTSLDLGQGGPAAPVAENRSEVYILKAQVPSEPDASLDQTSVRDRDGEDRSGDAKPKRLFAVPPKPRGGNTRPPRDPDKEPDPELKPKRRRGQYGD